MKLNGSIVLFSILCFNFTFGQNRYQKDFNEFWTDIHENYAYLEQQQIDWDKVKAIYEPQTQDIATDAQFISFLEQVLQELYNGHSSLRTNLSSSNRLVPSGQDMYVEKINNDFVITDIRKGFGAAKAGLAIGMKVVSFNGKPIEGQLSTFLPKFTKNHTAAMYQYALVMLFAGTHATKRAITVLEDGKEQTYFPDKDTPTQTAAILETEILNKNTAYIKINNSLGNYDLIAAFDKALDQFIHYKNIVIDLTETPSGGNTTVARAIMGRFVTTTLPYQTHEFDEKAYQTKRVWTEYVTPRKTPFKGKVYVLVGHWTGSMGEGIAIGFDGMKRAEIIGTKMAGLLGAIAGFELQETHIGFQFPTERLYHVNGTPREDFLPGILTENIAATYTEMKRIH